LWSNIITKGMTGQTCVNEATAIYVITSKRENREGVANREYSFGRKVTFRFNTG